jgi:hypothetical protein
MPVMNLNHVKRRIEKLEHSAAEAAEQRDLWSMHTEASRRAEGSLYEFLKQAWHVLEPGTTYVDGWHIKAISDHLEAVTDGRIRKLLINIPPRHMKSLTVAVMWPCWVWIHKPGMRWIFCSYAQRLATRDSLKRRRLIQSPWYQGNWGHRFRLTGDQNEKARFENTATGYCLATSVGGANTGEGADVIVCDDPHNVRDRQSEVMLDKTITWWDEVMSTRLNNPNTGARVIVMQRLHERDLSGHVLQKGGWDHLCLPAWYEEEPPLVAAFAETVGGEILPIDDPSESREQSAEGASR